MSSNSAAAIYLRQPRRARLISYLLLSAIILSATFGLVHQHGLPKSTRAFTAAANAACISADPEQGSTDDSSLQSKDCSICQQHRQMASGLLYGPVFTLVSPTRQITAATTVTFYLSARSTTRRGRAPPQTSLA